MVPASQGATETHNVQVMKSVMQLEMAMASVKWGVARIVNVR